MTAKKIAKRVAVVSVVAFAVSKLFLKKNPTLATVTDLSDAS